MKRPEQASPSAVGDCEECGAGIADRDVRCPCGSLVARYVADGIELKCRRCKRTIVVPVPPARSEP
jgi:hypothetical protein